MTLRDEIWEALKASEPITSHPEVEIDYKPVIDELEDLIKRREKASLQFVLDHASGGGNWRRIIISRMMRL